MGRWRKTDEQRTIDALIGRRIERQRRKVGMSQAALARAAGITQGKLYWIESGATTLSASVGIRVAEALDVPLAVLIPKHSVIGNPDEGACATSEA